MSSTLDELNAGLEYFVDLDPITRLLSLSAEKVVSQDMFIPTLARLDICIGYLEQHVTLVYNSDLYRKGRLEGFGTVPYEVQAMHVKRFNTYPDILLYIIKNNPNGC